MKPADLADVDYGVDEASFGVAETGSVCLTDADLGVNTLGYLPQHLIVLSILPTSSSTCTTRIDVRSWRQARYAVFHTGPSATADIEGVLINGAQGVRSLSVLLHPRRWPTFDGYESPSTTRSN